MVGQFRVFGNGFERAIEVKSGLILMENCS